MCVCVYQRFLSRSFLRPPEKAAAKAGAGSKTPKEKAYYAAWMTARNAALAAGKSLEEAKAAGRAAGKLARDAIA